MDVEGERNKESTILQANQKLSNKTRKKALLRRVFNHVEVDILEKGIGRKHISKKSQPHPRWTLASI